MHIFETEVVWQRGKECRVKAPRNSRNPALTVATPPEFGGPEGGPLPPGVASDEIGTVADAVVAAPAPTRNLEQSS